VVGACHKNEVLKKRPDGRAEEHMWNKPVVIRRKGELYGVAQQRFLFKVTGGGKARGITLEVKKGTAGRTGLFIENGKLQGRVITIKVLYDRVSKAGAGKKLGKSRLVPKIR